MRILPVAVWRGATEGQLYLCATPTEPKLGDPSRAGTSAPLGLSFLDSEKRVVDSKPQAGGCARASHGGYRERAGSVLPATCLRPSVRQSWKGWAERLSKRKAAAVTCKYPGPQEQVYVTGQIKRFVISVWLPVIADFTFTF
ncbi:hypothetical protein CB1_001894002 [Camelus ferus]|nr:hypothetical protein CB1_001894002 [Camelus ferus]